MDQEKMGKFIAECRKKKKMTQAELADIININSKTISKWETGISAPDISILEPLSKALDVSPLDILRGEKIKSSDETNIMGRVYNTIKFYSEQNNKESKKKITKIFLSMILIFITILFCILLKNNYNNCFIYSLDDKENRYSINGIMVDTAEKDIIFINSISIKDSTKLSEEHYYDFQYSLDIGKKQMFQVGNLLLFDKNTSTSKYPLRELFDKITINISEDSNYNEILDKNFYKQNFYINIKYLNDDYEIKTIKIPLKGNLLFSNNKIFYNGGKEF